MANAIDPKLYELMADRVQDYAIFLLSVDGRIMSWNAGAATIKQYRADEIIGQHFSIFYTPADIARDWPSHEINRAKAQGRFEDEGWRVRKDGSRFWANVVITALRDDSGKLLAFSKITRDLTARKREEEALRESEERFRLLVDGVQDYAIYLLTPEGLINSWNSGARRIKGYEAAEVIGSSFARFYVAADRDEGKPWRELALAREAGRAEDEGWRVRKDGSRFWAKVVVSALYDAEGSVRGFAKVTQDMTQHRHSQALELSSKSLNDFIAVLAHELRNPLAPISHAARLIAMAGEVESTRLMALGVIERQSAQLARIVDDLLDVSRVTRGKLLIDPKPAAVADVIGRALETVRPAMEAARHTLVVDLPDELPSVNADVLRLTQAVVNLLTNAIRYTEPGGHISVKAHSVQEEGATSVRIAVRDDGRGIDADLLESIFDMFIQGKEPLSRPATGLGVGLALARGIVELHHGTLRAFSEGHGRGAEFVISLPAAQPAPLALHAPVRPSTRFTVRSRRVLVVDDNVDAAQVMTSLLASHGHEAICVHNGADALEAFDAFDPDVVFLDVGMPGMSGLDVARRIRERNRKPPPRIVAVTGGGKPDDLARTHQAGFDAHMMKPVVETALLDVLEMAP